MGYNLYLRRKDPAAPLDSAPLTAALTTAGAQPREGGYALPAGGGRLSARLAPAEGGGALGLDLEMPFGAPEVDFRAALLLAAELGARLELAVMDPQRGGEVTPATAEATVAGWVEANKYAVDTAGLIEDVRSALPLEPPKPLWNTRTKILVALLTLGVLGYQLLTWALSLAVPPPLPID